MRLRAARHWVLAAILVAVNVSGWLWVRHELVGPGAPGRLRVLAALPDRDVDETDRFSLVFDRAVAATDAVDKPVDRALFDITPRPAGHWAWAAPDRLEFRLANRLPPGRRYMIRPTSDLQTQTGRKLVGKAEFRFTTRPLELVACRFHSADDTHVDFELKFNQPVDPADALRQMSVRDASTTTSLEPIALVQRPSESLIFRASKPTSRRIQIVLDAALAGSGGEIPLGEKITRELEVERSFALLHADAHRPALDKDITVQLRFSAELDTRQPAPKVQVNPPVEGIRVRTSYNSLVLEGPFECARKYTATVAAGVKAAGGQVLGREQRATFEIPDRSPAIKFPFRHGILIPGGNLTTDLRAVNVAGVHLRASRLHANNLVAHLRGAGPRTTARDVANRPVPLETPQNMPTPLALDLRALLGSPLGTYHVRATATNRNWVDDSAIVTVTDLGLTVKQERSGHLVWVTSLTTAQPMEGVRVAALSYNNQMLASATSDATGLARLAVPEKHPDGPTWAITAERGDDLSYILPDQREWLLDDVDQSGRAIPTSYDVMLYTERGVYRPGDTIHLTGIVRDLAGAVPSTFPLWIRVKRPDGREVAAQTVTPAADRHGTFHLDYPTRADGQTGAYRFTATLPGSTEPLGSTQAQVETFVPVRLELHAAPTRERFGPVESPVIAASARYLFGQPAANLPVSVSGNYQFAPFTSQKFPAFTFGEPSRTHRVEIPAIKNSFDPRGKCDVELAAVPAAPPGLWRGSIDATVTEPGGRSVSHSCSVLIDTTDRHIGLRVAAGRIVAAETPFDVEWIARTGSDAAAPPGPIEFTVARVDYDFEYELVHGRTVWKSVERLTPVETRSVDQNSAALEVGTGQFTCPREGAYRIRAVDRLSGTTAQLALYAAASDRATSLVSLNHPERLVITFDQDAYTPGSTAKALVRSPFAGTLLVTVETDRVLERRVLELHNNSAELEIPVDTSLRGGAFVTATAVRPIDPSATAWVPHRAMGMARLVTNHADRELPLVIAAPKQAEPGERINVTIETGTPADPAKPPVVHLWAVDEGILLTTAFATPNPHKHFFARRKAAVRTSDLYSDLLADYDRPASVTRIGGDGDSAAVDSLRSSPVPTRQREAAVIWQSVTPVAADGSATFELDLPKLTGELHLMAVAVDGDRYAAARHALTLTSPLLVEAAWPRFVAPDDRFRVPVKLFNSTAGPLTVTLDVEPSGPIEVDRRATEQPVVVQPSVPTTIWLDVAATATGTAEVRITAKAATESGRTLTTTNETIFAVRPVAPLHSESRLSRIDAGKPLTIDTPDQFLPGTSRTTLSVSGRPTVQLRPALERLIDYPYGCVEQTTSRLIAMLRLPELLAAGTDAASDDAAAGAVRSMIDAGIMRLWSMQTRAGGLGYWPGAAQPSLWGSAYAAGFLLDARRAGHVVDERFVTELVAYLESALDHSDTEMDAHQRAQVCRVLAGFNHPQFGWMARLADRLDALDMAGRAQLAGAWLEVGQRDRARAALPGDTLALATTTKSAGRLTSQVEQQAVLLGVLLDLDKEHAWVPALVRQLEAARSNGCWSNTLEDASALAALARYESLEPANADFEGTVHTNDGQEISFSSALPAALRLDAAAFPVRISSRGAGPIFVAATTEGLTNRGAFTPYDRQIKVRRRWTSAEGTEIDPAALRVGDLVWVETSVVVPSLHPGESVENVAVVDALPGGLEVENPRLATSARSANATNHGNAGDRNDHQDQPDRVEFLDDRVVLFTAVGSTPRVFRYLLRATSAGSFAAPPVQASSMYDPAFASVHGGGQIEIHP